MDLDAFRWLLGDDGQRLLGRAAEADEVDSLKVQAALRRSASAEHVAAALTQVGLRRRAEAKFGDLAARMYFTPEGLEQASRLPVATHRAARLQAAGTDTVIDLGCGIGGDLLAFARAGMTCAGVDEDPLRVAVAEANLAALGLGGAVMVADATAIDTSPFDAAYADPARRGPRRPQLRRRRLDPAVVVRAGTAHRRRRGEAAPGIPHEIVPEGVEAEWVSHHREVKEAVLWSGRLATTRRRATVIGQTGLATLTDEDDPGAPTGAVAAYFYEPDGAVIRAGLVTAVAAGVGGHLVDEHIAYVTSEQSFKTPFARSYRVVEELPYREKPLKAALKERGIGRLTIKKRGVAVVPDELRKRLALSGDAEATLVLTRVAGKGTALLVQPF